MDLNLNSVHLYSFDNSIQDEKIKKGAYKVLECFKIFFDELEEENYFNKSKVFDCIKTIVDSAFLQKDCINYLLNGGIYLDSCFFTKETKKQNCNDIEKNKLSVDDIKKLIEQGKGKNYICNFYGISFQKLSKIIQENNINYIPRQNKRLDQIKELAKKKCYNQSQIASILGISKVAVNKYFKKYNLY